MNTIYLGTALLIILSFGGQAIAYPLDGKAQTTVETIMTCQQVTGDQWVEVGIARSNGHNLLAYVIAHNTNNGTAKLVAKVEVSELYRGQSRVYHDRLGSFRLLAVRNYDGLTGEVTFQKRGLKSISARSLVCRYDDKVRFDQP